MRQVILSIFFSLFLLNANAQFDTNYVHLTKNQFSAYPMAETAFMQFTFKNISLNDKLLKSTLTSRSVSSVGFGMSFYRIGFSLSFQLPQSNIPELRQSKAFSFAGGYSYRHFYGELRYRDYQGFQKTDINSDTVTIGVRKDIHFKQLGVALDYFISKKYNFDANFKNYNVQKKSAATLLILAGANRFNAYGKYLFYDSTHTASEIEFIKELNVYSFKMAPGGAASVTYKGLYLSALIAMGASYNFNTFYGDNAKDDIASWAPVVEARAVGGYNSTKWFASISLNIENDFFFYDTVDLSVINVFFNLKAGYKFNSKYLGKIGKYL